MNNSSIKSVDVEDVKKAIDKKEKLFLIDVRTAQEFSRAKIAGSINIPLDQIQTQIGKIVKVKDVKIFVYCLSGSRSMPAVDMMMKMGYKNVFNVTSGLLAWRMKAFPTV